MDNYFKFTKDKVNGSATKSVLKSLKRITRLKFASPIGLVPEYECYDICQNAWSTYIHESLRSLIRQVKACPTAKATQGQQDEEKLLGKMKSQDYTTTIAVNATPKEALQEH